ncbi:hypothetical protein NE865_10298 [Phthorimaea operculella]|nr:hypothetical protein NE865_10298 [Phthorimaea operculella]
MGDEEAATLEGQFVEFAKFKDTEKRRTGKTINLFRQDFWMRQAKMLDDRKLTMTDTGVTWFQRCKIELDWDEWYAFMVEVCELKEIDQELMETSMTNCGLPGSITVNVPQYRDFFDTFKPKEKMVMG